MLDDKGRRDIVRADQEKGHVRHGETFLDLVSPSPLGGCVCLLGWRLIDFGRRDPTS